MAKSKIDTSQFREVPGFPGYYVAEDGTIVGKHGKPKKPQVSPEGFLRVNAQVRGKAKKLPVHEAVLLTYGPPKEKAWQVARHQDGDRTNNHISNLKWISLNERRELSQDASRGHHSSPRVFRLPPNERPQAILKALASGESERSVAERFGGSQDTVRGAKSAGKRLRSVAPTPKTSTGRDCNERPSTKPAEEKLEEHVADAAEGNQIFRQMPRNGSILSVSYISVSTSPRLMPTKPDAYSSSWISL